MKIQQHLRQALARFIGLNAQIILLFLLFLICIPASKTLASENLPAGIQMPALSPEKDERVAVFVQLHTPSVAAYTAEYIKTYDKKPADTLQTQHAEKLSADQQAVMGFLKTFAAQHISNFRVSANGVKCKIRINQIDDIRAHPAVKSVTVVPKKHRSEHAPGTLNGAQVLPSLGLTGKGVTIAIVGTGINYQLETFGGAFSFDNSDEIVNDPNIIEPGSFPTEKFTAGIDLAGANYLRDEDNSLPIEDPDPYEPFDSHETIVAAIAAGERVAGRAVPGVAPDAKLVAIKIFGDGVGATDLVADAIEYALDPNRDGSTEDKVDIINLSIQSPFGSSHDVDSLAVENAVAMGVVVVASAGNAGNIPFIHANPASAEASISVGSHSTPKVDEEAFGATAFHIAFVENGETTLFPARSLRQFGADLPASFSAPVVAAEPFDTCDPLEQDVTGKVVLFQYQNCPGFASEQQDLAQAAGAVASIQIENTQDRLGFVFADIPAYRMYQFYGDLLLAAMTRNPELQLSFDSNNTVLDRSRDFTVSDFSSRGPSFGAGFFKPDLIGPGEDILAADFPFAQLGTSFSAPFVSGVVAAMLQKHPDHSPAVIKAILQNTTKPSRVFNHPLAPSFPLSMQGVGMVQANDAIAARAVAMPGGVSFGVLNPTKKQYETRTITIKNLSDQRRHFKVDFEPGQANLGIELRLPREIHVAPKAEKVISFRLVADPRKLTVDQQDNTLIEADGWIVLSDELDTLRVGYSAAVEPAAAVDIVQSNAEHIRLMNAGFVDSQVQSFSYTQYLDTSFIAPEAVPFYPVDAGFRMQRLENNNVLTDLAFVFEQPFQTLMNKPRFVDLYFPDGQGELNLLTLRLNSKFFPDESEPFRHQLDVRVLDDDADLFESANVIADFHKGWFVLQVETAGNAGLSFNGDSAYAVYSEPFGGALVVGFDGQDQEMLSQHTFLVPAGKEVDLARIRQSQSEGGFLLVLKNAFDQEFLGL